MLFYYLIIFIIGSFFGWILELIYRSYFVKRLINPGFLNGPFLPLYGSSIVILYFLCSLNISMIPTLVLLFLIPNLFEFLTGLYFLKVFKIKLWNYSDNHYNYLGIICPLYSLIWFVLSLFFYFFIYPYISLNLLIINKYFILLIGFLFAFILIDIIISFKLLVVIKSRISNLRLKPKILNYFNLRLFLIKSVSGNFNWMFTFIELGLSSKFKFYLNLYFKSKLMPFSHIKSVVKSKLNLK